MAGEWGTSPWGGESPTESAGAGSGYWGGLDSHGPLIYNFVPPCGTTNVAVDQTLKFDIVDPRDASFSPGIDLTNTTVTIKIGATAAVTVFTAGAFQADWTGSTTIPIVGPPPGYTFTIVRDTDYPTDATITLTIVGANSDGETATKVCVFETVPSAGISDVEMLSTRRIKVSFTTEIKNSALTALQDITNWFVRPIPGNSVHDYDNVIVVKAVYPERRYNPTFVILDTSKLNPHQRYEVYTTAGFEDIHARDFDGDELMAGESRRTKIDSVLDGLPPMWEGVAVSNIFWVLASIAEQDEQIGGDQGIILADPLKRNY